MPELTKKPEKSQRPSDNAYWQQRLNSWDPVMTPFTVIMLLTLIGIIFLPIGATMLYSASNLFSKSIQYGGEGTLPANSCPGGTCTLDFKIDQKLEGKLYLYYELDNYYQNNIKYSTSVNWDQMRGKIDISKEKLEQTCDPAVTNGTLTLNPCGLIAKSFFTDSYSVSLSTSSVGGTAPTGLKMSFDNIRESIDEELFKQPSDSGSKKLDSGDTCVNGETMSETVCKTASSGLTAECKCYQNPKNPTEYFYFWYPQDDKTLYLYEMYPETKTGGISPIKGVKDPHFMNWMNIAALPNFRKLYGIIDYSAGFTAGDVLSFDVSSVVDVNSFQGKKFLVLTAQGALGVSNPGLGITFIVTGGACLFFAFIFFLKQEMDPRPLPTPASLNWAKKK